MSSSAAKTAKPKPWKQQGRTWHQVTPPSGMEGVELRIPNLTDLIRDEAVPERLRAIAVKSAAHPAGLKGVLGDELSNAEKQATPDEEVAAKESALRRAIEDVVDIQKRLITQNVKVAGEFLTLEDLDDPEFPAPDAEWFGAVMLREVEYDARGVRLGIEPLNGFERFRHFHDCDPSCGACAALQDEFSSVHLGLV